MPPKRKPCAYASASLFRNKAKTSSLSAPLSGVEARTGSCAEHRTGCGVGPIQIGVFLMSISKARQLREERAKLLKDAYALIPEDAKTMTAELRDKIKKMEADAAELQATYEVIERAEQESEEIRSALRPPSDKPQLAEKQQPTPEQRAKSYYDAWTSYMKHGLSPTQHFRGIRADQRSLLQKMQNPGAVSEEELRAIIAAGDTEDIGALVSAMTENRTTLSGTMVSGGQGAYPAATSGFFVPVGFVDRVEEALKWYGGMMGGGPKDPEIMETATGQ